jgi:4-methyl-5(b-hydroxyethyl)-thiazole monophosphate biosynthesis
MKILVPLAEGFEEIEAVSIIDVLRRANIGVVSAHLGKNPVTGSHGIPVTADTDIAGVKDDDFTGIVLPGGMPGSTNLKESDSVINLVSALHGRGSLVGAICAAPIALGLAGILKGKKATCFPGYETELTGARVLAWPVVIDGNIITAKGAGCAIPFALEIVGILKDRNMKDSLKNTMQVYWEL